MIAPRLTDERTSARRVARQASGHTAGKRQSSGRQTADSSRLANGTEKGAKMKMDLANLVGKIPAVATEVALNSLISR
eukprot:scaffold91636_cov36-Cyclotella_meneghiniana.AAC.2